LASQLAQPLVLGKQRSELRMAPIELRCIQAAPEPQQIVAGVRIDLVIRWRARGVRHRNDPRVPGEQATKRLVSPIKPSRIQRTFREHGGERRPVDRKCLGVRENRGAVQSEQSIGRQRPDVRFPGLRLGPERVRDGILATAPRGFRVQPVLERRSRLSHSGRQGDQSKG
jgi:hypothetical protein